MAMKTFLYILVFFIHLELSSLVLAHPCFEAQLLDDIERRTVGYKRSNGEAHINDYRLPKRWYKLPPGYTLADTSQQCGTFFNWWLRDTLPSTDSNEMLTICLNHFNNECYETRQIRVTSCDDGHVYELTPTDSALEGYCVVDKGLNNAAPDISSLQLVISAHIRNRIDISIQNRLDFYCESDFPEELHYDVKYYLYKGVLKSKLLKSFTNVQHNSSKVAFLENTKLTEEQLVDKNVTEPGFTISCAVKARNSSNDLRSQTIESDPKFFGIKINTRTPIRVKNKDIKKIQFEITVPFGCINLNKNCSLELEMLYQEKSLAELQECSISSLVQSSAHSGRSCGVSFTANITKPTFDVAVQFGSSQKQSYGLVYDLIFKTHKTYDHHPFFENYILPNIKVELQVNQSLLEDVKCYSVSDPHLWTFEGRNIFNFHIRGTFILYRHKSLEAEVQTKTKLCRYNHIYCNCGVAVRVGRDIFVIDVCDTNAPIPPRMALCKNGILSQTIKKKHNGYEIELPHGTKVKLKFAYKGFVDVHIYPSLVDYNDSDGLCGNLSNTKHDPPQKRPGSTETYEKSWRVLDSEDLFDENNYATLKEWSEKLKFCNCTNSGRGSLAANANCIPFRNCEKFTGDINTDRCDFNARRKKRDLGGIVSDVYRDPTTVFKSRVDFQFDSDNQSIHKRQAPYTNETARADCLNIMNTTVFQICDTIQDLEIENFIELCVLDALATDSMDWSMGHLESIKLECTHHVKVMQPLPQEALDLLVVLPDSDSADDSYQYPTLPPYKEPSSSTPITEELLQKIVALSCTNECSGHGKCIDGTCTCDEPFTSFDCSINKTQAPIMLGIPDRGECDLQIRPCARTSVFGRNIADTSSLTCRTTHFTIDGKDGTHVGRTEDVQGHFESIFEIFCPLNVPELGSTITYDEDADLDDVVARGYQISFSNGGQAFSEIDTIVIYNSLCVKCTKFEEDIVCIIKDGYCVNGGRCFTPGETFGCYTCSNSGKEWIAGPECNPHESGMKVWMIGVICGATVLLIIAVVVFYIKFQSKTGFFSVVKSAKKDVLYMNTLGGGANDKIINRADEHDYYNTGSDARRNDTSTEDVAFYNVANVSEYEMISRNNMEPTPYSTLDQTELGTISDATNDDKNVAYENLKLQVF